MKRTKKAVLMSVVCLTMVAALAIIPADNINAKARSKKAAAPKKAAASTVIVLDPGHDLTHHGTNYNGFDEASANLVIANSCKQALEDLGFKVYLTRTSALCPYGGDPDSTAACLSGRVDLARSVGAAAIISLHNDYDADLDTSVNGSKIIIPNAFYRPDICLAGLGLAQQILPNLTATGLAVNNWKQCPNGTGIVTRNSAVSTYPDGTPKDYYALINKAKTAGIPCIIIEHAYCTNPSDLANHLSTPEQLAQLGIADAKGIAAYFHK